jgi:hypothetical protein
MRHPLEQFAKKAARDDKLLEIADRYHTYSGTWQEGYCWYFARALQEYSQKGELYAVAICRKTYWTASHILLKIDNRFIDSMGGCSEAMAKKRHDEWFKSKVDSRVMPLHECDTEEIQPAPSNGAVTRLVRRLRELEQSPRRQP